MNQENNENNSLNILQNLTSLRIPYYCLEKVGLDFKTKDLNEEEIGLLTNCKDKMFGTVNIVAKVFENSISDLNENEFLIKNK